MKSTSKMMVIAAVLLVAAAVLVMPASSARVVNASGTIFDYETDINLSSFMVNGDQLARYTDDDVTKGQIPPTIPVANASNLDLTAIDLDGNYGTYYVVRTIDKVNETGTSIYIRDPTVTIGAVLEDDITESISGKTVTKHTPIAFRFDATEVGSYLPTAQVKVDLVTPGGGTITTIPGGNGTTGADVSLTGITLYAPRTYIRNVDISALEAGTYTAQAKWTYPVSFDDYASDSNSVSFTIATKDIAIESNKANVVRNNPFVVTVTGDSKTNYSLYIKDASVNSYEYPWIKPGQPSVNVLDASTDFTGGSDTAAADLANRERAGTGSGASKVYIPSTAAIINTNAGGTRSIEFGTNSSTDDRSYTVKVVNPDDSSKYDEVKVKVEEGEVTITAEGATAYYLGEEVKLSGTNTDSDYVYLFMTGPNLGDDDGVALDDVTAYASKGNYVQRDVESDDTWEYRWDTSNLAGTGAVLDAGTYTIYASSAPKDDRGDDVDKSSLSGVKYQTFAVQLKAPYLSLSDVGAVVAKGDELKITGIAEGKPDNVLIWIFGKNYRMLGDSETVEDDGTFEYTMERADTLDLSNGQYYVVVQHPMTDGDFNVYADSSTYTYGIKNTWSSDSIDLGRLAASDAATALTDMINSPNCDDTYRKVTFDLQEAWIRIDTIGDKYVGDKFTITGTTNLAVGDDLTIDVTSASFTATKKDEATSFSSAAGTVTVAEGTDANTWSFDVDGSDFKADQYTVTVESIDADMTQSSTFNVYEGGPTTTAPVGTTTTAPVGTTTTTAPVETSPTPSQPGFGALISLIGLGAVAFLVMRRN